MTKRRAGSLAAAVLAAFTTMAQAQETDGQTTVELGRQESRTDKGVETLTGTVTFDAKGGAVEENGVCLTANYGFKGRDFDGKGRLAQQFLAMIDPDLLDDAGDKMDMATGPGAVELGISEPVLCGADIPQPYKGKVDGILKQKGITKKPGEPAPGVPSS